MSKQLGFHNARPVRQRQEFHGFTGDLVMRALFDEQATSRDGFTNVFTYTVDRAITLPRHIGKQIQRMTADCIAEQIRFALQSLEPGRFVERNAGQLLQAGRWNQPALVRGVCRTKSPGEVLRLPKLSGSRFAKLVKGVRLETFPSPQRRL